MIFLVALVLVMALLFVTDGSTRTASDILRAVREIDPAHNPTLQPNAPPPGAEGDFVGTWCNKFVAWVTSSLGAPVPFAEYGTPANAQIAWLQEQTNWRMVSELDARMAASQGSVVLATYFNPTGSGHIALVLPYIAETRIAQAGVHNSNDEKLTSGFGNHPVVFFAHED